MMKNYAKFYRAVTSTIGLLVLLVLFILPVKSQIKSIPSPNIADLDVYGDIPVSLNKGIPNISLPLYAIQGKNIGLNVYLSYHSAGVRPNIPPGWLGEGWSLFAGGSITRIVNDQPDETDALNFRKRGFYYRHGDLNQSDWANLTKLSNPNEYTHAYDSAPDEFQFNFMGKTGKFYMNCEGDWVVKSDENFSVCFNGEFINTIVHNTGYTNGSYAYLSKTFEAFEITDGKGTKYTFGGADAIEYSDNIETLPKRAGELCIANTWYLIKIESADGSELIHLNYERGPFVAHLYKFAYDSNQGADGGGSFLSSSCSSWGIRSGITGKFSSPVYLDHIDFPAKSLKIEFQKSRIEREIYSRDDYNRLFNGPGLIDTRNNSILDIVESPYIDQWSRDFDRLAWLKLDRVEIKRTDNNELLKSFDFAYNTNLNEHLFLQSLIEKGSHQNARGKVHTFRYRDKGLLPDYISTITDHWGFNNGVLFPSINQLNFLYQRRPTSKVFYGIIKEIQYPTGGMTKFEFEQNSYGAYVNDERTGLSLENGIAGGLRIRKITHVDGLGNEHYKRYYYVKDYEPGMSGGVSSGILNVKPRYNYSFTGRLISGKAFQYYNKNNNPVIPLSSSSIGKYISYSQVAEVQADGSYTLYEYSDYHSNPDNKANTLYNTQYSPLIPFNSRLQERGKLLRKTLFDANSYPVYKEENQYQRVRGFNIRDVRSISKKSIAICSNGGDYADIRVAYHHLMHSYLPGSKSKTYYQKSSTIPALSTKLIYTYGEDKNVRKESTICSDGESSSIEYRYPIDYCLKSYPNLSSYQGNARVLKEMVDRKMYDFPVEITRFKDEKIVDSELHLYTKTTAGHFKPLSTKQLLLAEPMSRPVRRLSYSLNTLPYVNFLYSDLYENQHNYKRYDSYGNVLEYEPKSGPLSSFMWAYNHQYAVVVADGISSQDLENGVNAVCRQLTGGDLQHVYSRIGTLESYTQNDLWKRLNRLLRSDSRLRGVAIKTYVFDPAIGMISEADIAGMINYYEYDDFGRLKRIKNHDKEVVEEYEYHYQDEND
ncbi:hypothetical protein [Marinifilum caeruleilacunae]|uniref:RHS repeat protein n=1 Tax=Marinifilum caeruleilacunae TaxID=2499076 RepID=A0ABX1WVG6_9BACT|nr:hypothetical protein [Marinifilum caeruleilacunae]NOU60120.1 hypothetical protein [Marinifilum caeruleilacunae]